MGWNEKEKKELGERIAYARKRAHLSQQTLARRIGVTRVSCSNWESGYSTPNASHLIHLANGLGVNFEWLATARGEIERPDAVPPDAIQEEPGRYEVLSSQAATRRQEMMALFDALPERQQRTLLGLLRAFAHSDAAAVRQGAHCDPAGNPDDD